MNIDSTLKTLEEMVSTLKEGAPKSYRNSENGGVGIFTTNLRFPTYMIYPIGSNDAVDAKEYIVYKMNANAVMKAYKDGYFSGQSDRLAALNNLSNFSKDRVMMAIMHIQDSPALSKGISDKKYSREDFFKFITTNAQLPLQWWEKLFGKAPDIQVSDEQKIGNAVIHFPDNVTDKSKQIMLQIVNDAFQAFKKHKLAKLMTGDVRFVKLTGKMIGYYNLNDKDIKIALNAKRGLQTNQIVFHEYGHKYFYEFIPEMKSIIKKKYLELVAKGVNLDDYDSVKDLKKALKRDDVLTYDGSKRSLKGNWKIIATASDRVDLEKIDQEMDSADPKRIFKRPRIYGSWSMFLNGNWSGNKLNPFLKSKSHELSNAKPDDWFPTEYSKKNESEWFAELFAFYMLDHLKGEPAEFVKSLIK